MRSIKKIFLGVELIIYLLFIFLDLFSLNSTYVKYIGIILCFLYALIEKKQHISIALLFTLLADYSLLVLDNYYLIGVICFIFVQLIYYFYLKKNSYSLFIRTRIIIYILIITISLIIKLDLLSATTLIYFSTLLLNTISSYTNAKMKVFSMGLTLFVCCDICVGLYNILPFGILYIIVSKLMWVFYLPSQVLISLSKDASKL